MNDELFSQVMESIRQADAIFKGTMPPSRRFEVVSPVQSNQPEDTQAVNTQSISNDGIAHNG